MGVEWSFTNGDSDYLAQIAALPPEPDEPPRAQHVVSRVVLKGFAAPGSSGTGWALTPYDVVSNRVLKSRGLRGCGQVTDFLAYGSGSAEQLWQRTENDLPPAITAARASRLNDPENSRLRETIADAIALHYVRSPRVRQEQRRLTVEATEEVRGRTLREQPALLDRAFLRRYGMYPTGPEGRQVVLDKAIEPWEEIVNNGALARVSLESLFERIREGLRGMPLEIWHTPPGKELLIADNAAFTLAYDGVEMETFMAIGDSSSIALPVARDCLVAIGPTAKDEQMTEALVDLINRKQVGNATQYVYMRPGSGLEQVARATVGQRLLPT